MNEQIRRRRIERHCAATIRAISRIPGAEFRRQRLYLDGQSVTFQVPHLNVDVLTDSIWHCRGVADAIALRLLQSNRKLHHELSPKAPVAKLVFSILEQLRAESLAKQGLSGVTSNLNYAFDQWSMQCQGNGLLENELGLLIFGITQIVRSHLVDHRMDDDVNGIIESVRFRLAPIIGRDLVSLKEKHFQESKFTGCWPFIYSGLYDLLLWRSRYYIHNSTSR